MTEIYVFDELDIGDRNGSYGGNSGDKEGVFIINQDIPELKEAILRVVPNILNHINDCRDLITSIPERCGGYKIISTDRKAVYCKELEMRAELVLEPALERARNMFFQEQQEEPDILDDLDER